MIFQWDSKKAAANIRKHGISFDEAVTVFKDPLTLIFDDKTHSEYEYREIVIGHSVLNRLILIYFSEREDQFIRIFSARRATSQEQKEYKKTLEPKSHKVSDELAEEYHFKFNAARSNRFAKALEEDSLVVLLDKDVAEVFTIPEAVNEDLRALIEAMPTKTKRSPAIRER